MYFDPTVAVLGIYMKNTSTQIYTWMFITALLITAPDKKKSKCMDRQNVVYQYNP